MTEKMAYSVAEACAVLGLGRTRLYEEIKAGRIPVKKIGKRTLIPVSGLVTFLKG
jgi:excisionase family DNA binding protein